MGRESKKKKKTQQNVAYNICTLSVEHRRVQSTTSGVKSKMDIWGLKEVMSKKGGANA